MNAPSPVTTTFMSGLGADVLLVHGSQARLTVDDADRYRRDRAADGMRLGQGTLTLTSAPRRREQRRPR